MRSFLLDPVVLLVAAGSELGHKPFSLLSRQVVLHQERVASVIGVMHRPLSKWAVYCLEVVTHRPTSAQKSAITSPPARVLSAANVTIGMLSRMNCTCPSPNKAFIPPLWKL